MAPVNTHRRRFLSGSIRFGGVVEITICLALSGSWLGLLGRWHWSLDLFSQFRWQYLAACVLAVVWTPWRRRRPVLLFSLATLLLNGWLIGSLMLYSRMPPAPTAKLRVISLNVLTSNPDKSKVMRYLRESGADIIFLIEVNVAWSRATEVLKAAYPYGTAQTREDNFGIILLSRIPLTNVSIFTIGDADLPSVEAHVRTEKQEWVIIGTHPLPPMGAFYAHQRDVHLAQIASHVEKLNLPVLAVGDLNATPWSEGMRVLTKGSRLRLAPDSWRPTWQVGTPLAIPIDHALCCGVLQILSKRIGPDVGSDHRPIELEIGLVE